MSLCERILVSFLSVSPLPLCKAVSLPGGFDLGPHYLSSLILVKLKHVPEVALQ